MTSDTPIREPDQIRQNTARKLRVVQVSDHFQAILGCLLGEDWTKPRLLEMVITPDCHMLGRGDGESTFKVSWMDLKTLSRKSTASPRWLNSTVTKWASGWRKWARLKGRGKAVAKQEFFRLPVVSAGAEFIVMGYLMRRNILAYIFLVEFHHTEDDLTIAFGSESHRIRLTGHDSCNRCGIDGEMLVVRPGAANEEFRIDSICRGMPLTVQNNLVIAGTELRPADDAILKVAIEDTVCNLLGVGYAIPATGHDRSQERECSKPHGALSV